MSLAQWHSTLNEIQSLGFDFGARTISAGPTTKRPSAEPALLAGDDADPFDLCYRREQHEILGRALSHLREREREIISLYYQQELTMKQIAERMNIDESRVSQLHSAALAPIEGKRDALLHPRPAISKPETAALDVGWRRGRLLVTGEHPRSSDFWLNKVVHPAMTDVRIGNRLAVHSSADHRIAQQTTANCPCLRPLASTVPGW